MISIYVMSLLIVAILAPKVIAAVVNEKFKARVCVSHLLTAVVAAFIPLLNVIFALLSIIGSVVIWGVAFVNYLDIDWDRELFIKKEKKTELPPVRPYSRDNDWEHF